MIELKMSNKFGIGYLLLCLVGSRKLNTIRYAQYMKLVTSAKSIDPQKLPPTANPACYVLTVCVRICKLFFERNLILRNSLHQG